MVEASSPHRRGLNMGLLQGSAAGLLGAVIGPPLLVALAEALGWRHAFIVSLLPGLLIAWLIWRHVRPDPPARSAGAARRRSERQAPGTAEEPQHPALHPDQLRIRHLVHRADFLYPDLPGQRPRLQPGDHGQADELPGRRLGGLGLRRTGDIRSHRPSTDPGGVLLLAACCPLALLYAPNATSLGLLLLLTYTGLGCFTLFMATIPAETVSRGVIATALGLIMGLGELVGGFLAPTVAGFAADRFGLSIVMWMSCGGALLAAFLSLFLRETAPAVLARQRSAPTSVLQGNQP